MVNRYGTPYNVRPVTGEQLALWNAAADDGHTRVAELRLFGPNPYIPRNLDILRPPVGEQV